MSIYKSTSRWSGFPGSPGYTNLYFQGTGDGDSAQAIVDRVGVFWNAIKGLLGNAVSISVQPEVEVLDPITGVMERFDSATPPATITSTGVGSYSVATGACISWLTGAVRNGRRVRGRTFIVPLASAAYDADGTLGGSALTTLRTAAANLAAASGPNLAVWSRPSAAGAADGMAHFVIGSQVTDKVAVLRSRRD